MPAAWTSLRCYYGLEKPYDFRVALPFLLASIGTVSMVAVVSLQLVCGSLNMGTARFDFFAYMAAVLASAALFSRLAALSMALFVWFMLEMAVALSSYVVPSSESFFPANRSATPPDLRFTYHPLLQIVPRVNWRQAVRIDASEEALHPDWPVNWKQAAGVFTFQHNSLGLRGREPSAEDYARDMIFVYGGSTTYDTGVTQGGTWTERLQAELNGRYTVLNFGVPAHSTVEHLIQTAFYQQAGAKRPVCAIYYVGWNDIHNAYIDNLDRAYADWHLPSIVALGGRRPELWAAKYSPLIRLLSRTAAQRFDTIPNVTITPDVRRSGTRDSRLESIFSDNVKTIAAINVSRGINTIFVGQVLNEAYFGLRPGAPNLWAPHVKDEDMWQLQADFNVLLKQTALSSGATYIDAGADNFAVDDFTDQGHFSARGAQKFAALIANRVGNTCGHLTIRRRDVESETFQQ